MQEVPPDQRWRNWCNNCRKDCRRSVKFRNRQRNMQTYKHANSNRHIHLLLHSLNHCCLVIVEWFEACIHPRHRRHLEYQSRIWSGIKANRNISMNVTRNNCEVTNISIVEKENVATYLPSIHHQQSVLCQSKIAAQTPNCITLVGFSFSLIFLILLKSQIHCITLHMIKNKKVTDICSNEKKTHTRTFRKTSLYHFTYVVCPLLIKKDH